MAPFKVLTQVNDLAEVIVDALFPRDCAACAAPLASPGPFCPSCSELTIDIDRPHCPRCGLPGIQTENFCPDCQELAQSNSDNNSTIKLFSRARAIYVYGAVVEQAIRRCKFANTPHIAQMMGQHMAQAFDALDLDPNFDAFVPVPVGRQRMQSRGFDQAVLMAKAIGNKMQKPVFNHALRRQRETEAQAQQSRQKRRDNMQNAFVCAQPQKIKDKKIMLIDDVMTTGMTAQSASHALYKAGAKKVEVFTFARAVLEHDPVDKKVIL